MKISKKLISTALAAVMVASTAVVGGVTASAAAVKKPTGVKVKNTEHALKITWSKVKGATKYKVYRGSKVLKTTKKLVVKDFSVKAGKNYTYKVKAVKGKKTSKASKSVKATRLNYPNIKSVANQPKSVKVKWTKKSGATQYVVYRKTTGSYKKVATVKVTNYKDTDVTAGTKYTYKIVSKNKKTGSTSIKTPYGRSVTYLPRVTGVAARETKDTKSIEVKWNAAQGAASYDVYRIKAGDSAYTKVANVADTKYTDTDVSNNPTAYAYQVYAVADGSKSVASKEMITPYAPKTAGVNRYYLDEKMNPTVVLELAVGEKYKEGKAAVEYFNLNGLYKVEVVEGQDVVTVSDNVITAVKAGTAKIKVSASDTVLSYADKGNNRANSVIERALKNHLTGTVTPYDFSTKDAYVIVNVK